MKKFIVRRLTINRSVKVSLIKDQFVLWDHGAIFVRKINETLHVILAQRSVEEVFSWAFRNTNVSDSQVAIFQNQRRDEYAAI